MFMFIKNIAIFLYYLPIYWLYALLNCFGRLRTVNKKLIAKRYVDEFND